jgi:SNF2 family DNA or RNA helicase
MQPGQDAAHDLLGRLDWHAPLFSYQRAGVAALLRHGSLLLADDMGLGKTIQAIAALRCLRLAGAAGPALIVAPAGLVLQWRRELRLWAPELGLATVMGPPAERALAWQLDAQVFLASYETVRTDARLDGVAGRHWGVVILDEAQRIKNPAAEVSIAVKQLRRQRAWALTGTPLENRMEDLVSILDFVAPGRFDPGQYVVGLRRLLGQVQLRRRRTEVLHDLPPKLASEVVLALAPAQRIAYRRAEQEGIVRLQRLGADLRITHVLELILRLKQICNACPETDESAKLDDLRRRLAGMAATNERALVFSQFTGEQFGARRLHQALGDFQPLLLTGAQDAAARADVVRMFEHDQRHKVLILSLRAGGVGLNLTAASQVFHFDRWWNPAVETQAEDRAHRIGQHRPVHVHAYLTADTIEERIAAILHDKRALFADMVEGVTLRALARLDLPTLLGAVDPSLGPPSSVVRRAPVR